MIYLILAAQAITLVLVAWLIVLRQKSKATESSADQHSAPETPVAKTEEKPTLVNADEPGNSTDAAHEAVSDTPDLWLEAAELEESEGAKLDTIEDALKRFPSSRELFSTLVEMLIPLIRESENLYARRKALSTLHDYTEVFQSNCSLDDYSYGQEISAEVRELAEVLAQDIAEQTRTEVSTQLDELEEKVQHIVKQNGSSNEDEVDEVARLDESINKEVIRRDEALKKRYESVSNHMISFFQNQDDDTPEVDLRKYSKQALEAAAKAWRLFHDNENKWKMLDGDKLDYNDKKHLRELVKHLGGWQPQFMTSETHMYVQSVYSEIFQSLKPDGRALMTTMMIEAKEVQPHE